MSFALYARDDVLLMKAAIYVCEHAGDTDVGLPTAEQQEARLRAYLERQCVPVVAVYSDTPAGVLRTAPERGCQTSRCGVVSLLDQADAAPWLLVAVSSLDRLRRSDMKLDGITELASIGKRVAVLGEDLGAKKRPQPRVKRRPPETVPERLLRGRKSGARNGLHQSGPAPYGYVRSYGRRRKDSRGRYIGGSVRLAIEPEEAEVVRLIFFEYLRRRSMKRLIDFLDAQGHRTRRDKQWSRAGVSWILKNETYLGRVHFGRIRAKGQHPAIISPITFNKVAKLIKKNNKRAEAPAY